jgi:hypothetical protein
MVLLEAGINFYEAPDFSLSLPTFFWQSFSGYRTHEFFAPHLMNNRSLKGIRDVD